MTGPVPPIVPRPPAGKPVSPVLRSEPAHRREERDDTADERREHGDRRPGDQGRGPVVDADGHVDLLA